MSDAPPLIDESVALFAARLVAPTRSSDRGEVARLRAAVVSDLPAIDAAARQWTGLGEGLGATQCRVVGRIGWVRANLATLTGAFTPLEDKISGSRAIASRALGLQVGALLGLLSTKVLGQYVLPLDRPGSGQLVVVGPNLLDLADEHGAIADDIRRTVLLHEVTHRLQFEAVPWLGDFLRDLVRTYLEHARLDPAALVEAAARLPEAVARIRRTGSVQPLLEVVLTEEQAGVVEQAQGLMSLLEGHGNAVMFSAEGVARDTTEVREALTRRKTDLTSKVLSAVAGLEWKKRQYEDGEVFVRAVVDAGGVATLNRAFDRAELLPSADEIQDPERWLERVGVA